MTMVNQGIQAIPYPLSLATPQATLIDAADEVAGAVIPIAVSGNIRYIHWRTATVTTGATVTVGLVTVDGSGNLTTTPWSTTSNGLQAVLGSDDNTWFRTQLTLDAPVTMGDNVGVIVKQPAVSAGSMNVTRGAAFFTNAGFPHAFGPTESTKIDLAGPGYVLEYDDGSFHLSPLVLPFQTNILTVDTGQNPDEVALYFTEVAKRRVVGWWANFALAAASSYRMALYVDGNNTPVLTQTMDSDFAAATTLRVYTNYFTSTYTTTVGVVYRLAVLPLGTEDVSVRYLDAPTGSSPNVFNSISIPGSHYSARNRSGTSDPDSAAWTQTTSRLLQVGLLYDQIDDGTGSGGGAIYHGAMAGGLL